MNNKEFKVALIGCGAISKKHMTAIGRVEGLKVVAAHDVDKDAAKSFSKAHGLPVYTDLEKMVTETDPAVFDIITPSGIHAQNFFDLIHYGRHFIVEKPIALRLDQIDQIIEECDKKGLRIFVVQQNRFNPPIRKLKEALDRDRFGKLVMGTVRVRWCRLQEYYDQKPWRGTWAQDGGVLTNQASHHIDMLVWMMGDVESVMAKTSTRLAQIEAEDTGVAILKFRNGALGIVEATTATRPRDLEGSISVLGEKGSVEVSGFFMNAIKTWNFSEPDPMDEGLLDTFGKVPGVPAWNHSEFFTDVVNSLRDGKRALVDGLEGRKSVELINAIYESNETGKEVFLRFSPRLCRLGVK